MGRRQGNMFDRKEVMDLMQQRLDGSIKSLRELKDRIAEETGEQIALTTLWQQIHKMRKQLMNNKPSLFRTGVARNSRIDASKISIKNEDIDSDTQESSVMTEYPEEIPVARPSLRRSARASKRKSYSPTPTFTGSELRKDVRNTTESNSSMGTSSYVPKDIRMAKNEKVVKRRKTDEPKSWDKNAEELIRQEALKHEEELAADPLAKAKSKVWLFCEKIDEGGESKAKCRICGMVMVRKLGSTRAMLRHLRKMHDKLIDGIIRPVTKRVTAIAGKPRADDGFDIDDDSAWVEEVDEEDVDDYDEQQYMVARHCIDKEKAMTFDTYSDSGAPSYTGEVFIREDGTYADGDEFVDVVYVQDENTYDEMSKPNDDSSFVANEMSSLEVQNEAATSRLKRSISDSELLNPLPRNNCNDHERYENANLMTVDSRSLGTLNVLTDRGKVQHLNDEILKELRFSQLISASIHTFPAEQRDHIRGAVMQFIEELKSGNF